MEEFYLSAITIHELEIGALRAEDKDARKGAILRRWLAEYILRNFRDRILPIDVPIAVRAAQLQIDRTRQIPDAFIAATAYVHGFSVVTRNVRDFADTAVNVINPWLAPS